MVPITGRLVSCLTAPVSSPLSFNSLDSFSEAILRGEYRLIDESLEGLEGKLVGNRSAFENIKAALKKYPLKIVPGDTDEEYHEMFNKIAANTEQNLGNLSFMYFHCK